MRSARTQALIDLHTNPAATVTRRCTHCGAPVSGYRKTCSETCRAQRCRTGGAVGHRTQAERGGYWTARSTGDARSVMMGGQLQVLDPVALVAAGYALRDVWGGVWEPL